MKKTSVIFTSLLLTLVVLTGIAYFQKENLENLENYREEITLGGVVEILDSDMGEIEEEYENEEETIIDEEQTEEQEPIEDEKLANPESSDLSQEGSEPPIEQAQTEYSQETSSSDTLQIPLQEEANSSQTSNQESEDEKLDESLSAGGQPLTTYAGTISYGETTKTATLTGDSSTMNNFSYKTITVGDYVLMDRNLGATEEWTYDSEWSSKYSTPIASYGYYYQWGNNYGFSPATTAAGASSAITVADEYMPSKYSSPNWNTAQPWSTQNNLWGNDTNTTIARQGPCPYGWHVPSNTEWHNIYNAWNSASNKSTSESHEAKNFAKDLKMPPAGYRSDSSLSFYDLGGGGRYWSSTPGDSNAAYRLYFDSSSINPLNYYNRSIGFTVRCVQSFPTQTLTFHADQGTITPESVTVEKGTTTTAPTATNENADSVTWYTESTFENEFDFSAAINADYNLYAKWTCKEGYTSDDGGKTCHRITSVIYGTEEYTATIEGNGGDEMNTFKFKTLTVGDYTLMDRNLGATNKWTLGWNNEYQNTYGYYYQWGNNYGFLPQNTTNEDLGLIVVEDEYIPSKYSNSNWNAHRPWSEQDDLWGDVTDTQVARQGPCPNGWHVPSKDDWVNIIKSWCSAEKGNVSCSDGKNFAEDLLLPPASGIMGGEGLSFSALGELGLYWSSTPIGPLDTESAFDVYINADTIMSYNPYPRSLGHPVRCVENYETQTITFHTNGGTMEKVTKEVKKGGMLNEPKNPAKENEVFIAWYTDEGLTHEFDFSTPIISDIDLYAKYGEGGVEWIEEEGLVKIYVGDKAYYIRDRNVGVDKDIDIRETTKTLWHCFDTDENGEEFCNEDERIDLAYKLYGDYYFWGNNTGVKIRDLGFEQDFKIDSTSLPIGFTHSRISEENTGWGKGENNNPCNGEGEYLPTSEDWLNIMKIYGNIYGYEIFYAEDMDYGIKQYVLYDPLQNDQALNFFNDLMLHPTGAIFFRDEDNLSLEPASYVNYVWLGMNDEQYVGFLSYDGGLSLFKKDGYIISEIEAIAMPVRCFVHPQNDSTNEEETVQPISFSGGGGRSITNDTMIKEHNSADANKVEGSTLKDQITQQKLTKDSQIKGTTSMQSLSTYYNHISKEDNAAYEWARSKNITTLAPNEANPNGYVKRGEMAKMVVNFAMNVLGMKLPEFYPQCTWGDDERDWESKELKKYAAKSCALGIMGIDMEKFDPKKEVSRAEFGTILSRMLWGSEFNVKDSKVEPYYTKHLRALKANGIMENINNPEKTKEVRKRVWTMMQRTIFK